MVRSSGSASVADARQSASVEWVRQALKRYDAVLEDPVIARASNEILLNGQRAMGISMHGRPVARSLRPRLIGAVDHAWVSVVSSVLAGALQRLANFALDDGELGDRARSVLAPHPLELALAKRAPRLGQAGSFSRLDAFFGDDRRLRFVEYNAHSPVGPMTQDALVEIYHRTPAMQEFIRQDRVHSTTTGPQYAEALLHAWERGGAPGGEPRVAVVECLPTKFGWEFTMLADRLRGMGVAALLCSMDDLRYDPVEGLHVRADDGGVWKISVVHRRADMSDLITRYGIEFVEHPLTRAWTAGACVILNPLTTSFANKKSVFALANDPELSAILSHEEKATADRHLPWTALVGPGTTSHEGDQVDLLDFAQARRDSLVLKPNDDYGGNNVICGWDTTDGDWKAALQAATRQPYVLQERVSIPQADYPFWKDGQAETVTYQESTDPCLIDSTTQVSICRLSQTSKINISAGGQCLPIFQLSAPRDLL